MWIAGLTSDPPFREMRAGPDKAVVLKERRGGKEQSGHVTHLVLMEGHLWGKKEVTLPLSAIDHAEADTVDLKLSKRAVKELPAVPIRRRHHRT